MTNGISDFLKYNLWANHRVIDVCDGLSDAQLDFTGGGVYGSIRETLRHVLSAEEWYVFLLTGDIPGPRLKELADFPGWDELRKRCDRSGNALITISAEDDLDRVIVMDDGAYETSVIMLLLQAVQHGIDHRSQIATLLSHQDVKPPRIDGWSYNDSLQKS